MVLQWFNHDETLSVGVTGRLFTGVTSVIVFLLALLLIVVVVPTQNRPGNSTRTCTLLHCGLALLSSSLGLVCTLQNVLNAPFVHASLAALIAVSQVIDGHLTWQRYLIVHEHRAVPSKAKTYFIYSFIVVCLSLPFLVAAIFWGYEESAALVEPNSGLHPHPSNAFTYAGFFLIILSVPCHLTWDTVLGCSVITQIHELRLLIAAPGGREGEVRDEEQLEMQHQTLLLLARKTILYIIISMTLNIFIHLPLMRLLPFVSVFTMTFNLSFALASHYCFNTRGAFSEVFFFPLRACVILCQAAMEAWVKMVALLSSMSLWLRRLSTMAASRGQGQGRGGERGGGAGGGGGGGRDGRGGGEDGRGGAGGAAGDAEEKEEEERVTATVMNTEVGLSMGSSLPSRRPTEGSAHDYVQGRGWRRSLIMTRTRTMGASWTLGPSSSHPSSPFPSSSSSPLPPASPLQVEAPAVFLQMQSPPPALVVGGEKEVNRPRQEEGGAEEEKRKEMEMEQEKEKEEEDKEKQDEEEKQEELQHQHRHQHQRQLQLRLQQHHHQQQQEEEIKRQWWKRLMSSKTPHPMTNSSNTTATNINISSSTTSINNSSSTTSSTTTSSSSNNRSGKDPKDLARSKGVTESNLSSIPEARAEEV